MNNTDCHPRVLSLSSPSGISTPNSSNPSTNASTPMTQSRRPSQDGEYFAAAEDKTHKTLKGAMNKMWKEIKQHAVEHHRSVNMAYQASYGAGTHARFQSSV